MSSFIESLKELQSLDFADLDVQEIGVWPAALKVIILILLLFLLLVGGYFYKVKEIHQEIGLEQNKEAQLLAQYNTKAFEAANLEAYRAQMVELEAKFGALLEQLPKDTEVPGLLEDITELAYGSGLSMRSIALQPEKAQEYYVELPIKIDVAGGYHDFGAFVSGVAALPRIVTLHDFSIKATGGALLNMVIEAKTYRYKSEDDR